MTISRRFPIGAEVMPGGGVHFRVWAPRRRRVEVVFEDKAPTMALDAELDGYHAGFVASARPGSRYRYRLDGGDLVPDPASRFQPEGPHGPSEIIDARAFSWTDAAWKGCPREGQIIYEMHIGTFTRAGTWSAAAAQLPELAELGITMIEVMPVAAFPGRFGWGYDGVALFAPTQLYGRPDDFRDFVDRAHGLGIGVILDVVYNHIGPDGNYLPQFSADYFTDRYQCEWGEALNFDGPNSGPVREFFLSNAAYWIEEYHLDGLRLDATQQIFDASREHILLAIGKRVREAARGRATFVVAESEAQYARMARPIERGGFGLDAIWNDDFHHSAHVALTGHREAYYGDYQGTPSEFLAAAKWGFLFQGQHTAWKGTQRGSPAFDLEPWRFVNFLQNHDQIANSGNGARLHQLTSPGRYRAMTALLLLGPGTPMLFQGQEFGSSSPFLFFADHNEELAPKVAHGRAEFLARFPSLTTPEARAKLAEPADPRTYERCQLNWAEREKNGEMYRLHRDLLRQRRSHPVFGLPRRGGVDGAVLGPSALALRYWAAEGADRLLIVNLGPELQVEPAPEPLLAPPDNMNWCLEWSSADVSYGGSGSLPEFEGRWHLPGEIAFVLAARPSH